MRLISLIFITKSEFHVFWHTPPRKIPPKHHQLCNLCVTPLEYLFKASADLPKDEKDISLNVREDQYDRNVNTNAGHIPAPFVLRTIPSCDQE
jgi:hypothetical protein